MSDLKISVNWHFHLGNEIYSWRYSFWVFPDSKVFLKIQYHLPGNVVRLTNHLFLFLKTRMLLVKWNAFYSKFSFECNINRHWLNTENFRKALVVPPLDDGRETNMYNKLDFVWILHVRLFFVCVFKIECNAASRKIRDSVW